MVEYCQTHQREALSAVGKLARGEASEGPQLIMLGECLERWQEGRGYDFRMVMYCYDRQSEAYERLQRQ
jgi:hypothetical protein